MEKSGWSERIGLFAVSFLVHIPFLFNGYGREEDAWAQALNARIIWESQIYEVSRLPGHPLYELLLALLWPINHQYWFFNGISALATSLAVLTFYNICKQLRLSSPLWLSIAFCFVPAFFIAGNYTIDYNIGLLFVLLSFLATLKGKWISAGILLGIATGVRISHLGFLLPWILLLAGQKNWLKSAIKLSISAALVVTISYLPPLLTYGMGFIDFHKPPFPSVSNILYKLSFGLLGVPLLVFIAWTLISRLGSRKWKTGTSLPRNFKLSLWTIFLLQIVVFARLPFKSEFLIPFLPFGIIYLGTLLPQNRIRIMALCSLASSFVLGFDYLNEFRGASPSSIAVSFSAGGKDIFLDPIKGPAFIDLDKRRAKSALVDEVNTWIHETSEEAFIIAGWYWPELELKMEKRESVLADYYSTEAELKAAQAEGRTIYYLPEINAVNAKIESHYLADSLGNSWIDR